MVTTLVTGGAGFIGSHIVRALSVRGDDVIVYGHSTAQLQRLKDLEEKVEIAKGEILDLSYVLHTIKRYSVEKIVHTVAIVDSATTIDKPRLTAEVNILGTLNILEAARIMDLGRVVDISSESVYGPFQYEPLDENHPLRPMDIYALSKATAEKFGFLYHELYGIDYAAVRGSYIYGPGFARNRPPKTLVENALLGKPTMIRGGDHKLDHTYIKDFVQGLILLLDAEALKHRAFNIVSGEAHTTREMAEVIEHLIPGARFQIGPGLPEFASYNEGDISFERARRELKYEPKYDLETGLREYIEWYRKIGLKQYFKCK